ncbi:lipocalin-like domain-containing protein [Marinobacter salicampi]|uniref:lipocalin-like domain-containing protein n=1 Tax=Marinobacter salicampi TaxID=435907 RepID=UPI001A93F30C|nr:lipocalin-like domain-containing protein [Marinobacter salicampi]
MSHRKSKPITLMLLLSSVVTLGCSSGEDEVSGFAGLAEQIEQDAGQGAGYLQPGPGDAIELPADLGPHPQHRIEWWYLTANLTTGAGEPLGLQWTQFRQALEPRSPQDNPPPAEQWPLQSVWMAHAAVSHDGEHYFHEKLARGDIGHAGAVAEPFQVWLDAWRLAEREDPDGDPQWRLQVNGPGWGYNLLLQPRRAPVFHGDQGFSAKSAGGEGSMYFSYVDMAIEGTVTLKGETLAVHGTGWLDREWSSQFLKSGQKGWDWLALHLDSGAKLMAFRLREEDGGPFKSGTWVPAEGEPISLSGDEVMIEPVATRSTSRGQVPTRWQVKVPGQDLDVVVSAVPGDYWNLGVFPYWESPVRVSGSHEGRGYLELTGYGADE